LKENIKQSAQKVFQPFEREREIVISGTRIYLGRCAVQFRAIVSKSVKRFSDKNCGKNKELEHSAESISAKNA